MEPPATPAADLPLAHAAALGALAERLTDASERAALLRLAAAPDPANLPPALAAIRRALPRWSLLALRACAALTAPQAPAHDSAQAWLLQAQAHAMRRAAAPALAALDQARPRLVAAADAVGLARGWLVEGQAALASGQAQAITTLTTARLACEQAGDRAGAAEACLELARCHAEQNRAAPALVLVEEAARLADADPWLTTRADIQAADAVFARTDYPAAISAYERLAPICQAEGWRLDQAHLALMHGLALTQQGQLADAEPYLDAALTLYSDEETDYYTAVCWRAIAQWRQLGGRYAEAETAIRQALAAFEALQHPLATGRCYLTLGVILHIRNRYDEALAAYEQAAARFGSARLPYDQLSTRINQALIYEQRGYYHAALERYEAILAASRRVGLTSLAALCLESMAALQGRLGRPAEGVALYRRARRAFRRTGALRNAHECAASQAGMLRTQGQPAAARRLLGPARRYFQAHDLQEPLAVCALALGEMAVAEAHPAQALTHYRQALAYFDATDRLADAALTRTLIGEALLAAGQPGAAEASLAAALPHLAPGLPDLAARAEHALGRAAHAQGRLRSAAEHWSNAVAHVGIARRGIVTEEHAGSFFAGRRHIYEDALDGWLAADEPAEALAVAEASKGQVLASLLQGREVLDGVFAGQSPATRAILEECWRVGRELEALRARWPSAEASGSRSLLAMGDALKTDPADAVARSERLADEQAALFARLRRSSANFDLLDPGEPCTVTALRSQAAAVWGRGWSALTYYLRRDRVTIFWLTPDDVQAWNVPLGRLARSKLAQAVDPQAETRELIYAGRLRGIPQPNPPGPRLLRDLADLLIPAPARVGLDPQRALLIAPHGLLHTLPFHALPLADGRPLAEHATIHYAPTLGAWGELARRQAAAQPPAQALFCGVGNFGGRAPALQHAEAEARRLAERFGAGGRLLLGAQVNHARWQSWSDDGTLAGLDLIHLATHAVFDGAQPIQSRILLHDGALAVPDLFRLRLNARLVTLSACQTALSALEPGDELLGLREALLAAGAGALLVSLWAVDDASTARLMGDFYDRLLAGSAPAAALAGAQRALITAGEPPYAWAPFQLVG